MPRRFHRHPPEHEGGCHNRTAGAPKAKAAVTARSQEEWVGLRRLLAAGRGAADTVRLCALTGRRADAELAAATLAQIHAVRVTGGVMAIIDSAGSGSSRR